MELTIVCDRQALIKRHRLSGGPPGASVTGVFFDLIDKGVNMRP